MSGTFQRMCEHYCSLLSDADFATKSQFDVLPLRKYLKVLDAVELGEIANKDCDNKAST